MTKKEENTTTAPALYMLTDEHRRALVEELKESVISALNSAGIQSIISNRPTDQQPLDEWGSRNDACNLLKCSLPTLHSYMKAGIIDYRKAGRKTLVNMSDARRKLESGELARYHRR